MVGGSSSSSSRVMMTKSSASSPTTKGRFSSGGSPRGVLLVSLGLQKGDLPEVLREAEGAEVVFFPWDWQREPLVWRGLEGAFGFLPLSAAADDDEDDRDGSGGGGGCCLEEAHPDQTNQAHSPGPSSLPMPTSMSSPLAGQRSGGSSGGGGGDADCRVDVLSSSTHSTLSSTISSTLTSTDTLAACRSEDWGQVSEDSAVYTDFDYDGTVEDAGILPKDNRNREEEEEEEEDSRCGTPTQKYLGTRKGREEEDDHHLQRVRRGVGGKDDVDHPYQRARGENRFLVGEERRQYSEDGAMSAVTRAGEEGNVVESAVLQRLGNAGLRRESVEEVEEEKKKHAITRVFVRGNTVCVDTISPSAGGVPARERQASCSSSSAATGRRRENDQPSLKSWGKEDLEARLPTTTTFPTAAVQERNSGLVFNHRKSHETNVRRSPRSSGLSSAEDILSTQSPRRKFQHSEEHGLDVSHSTSLTAQIAERPTSPSPQRSAGRDGGPHSGGTAREGQGADRAADTSASSSLEASAWTPRRSTLPPYHRYPPREQDKPSSGGNGVESVANSVTLTPSTSANTSSCDRDILTNQTRGVYTKTTSPTQNSTPSSVDVSTEDIPDSNKGHRHHHHHHQQPQKHMKHQVSMPTAKEAEETKPCGGEVVPEPRPEPITETGEQAVVRRKVEETPTFITSLEDEMTTNDLAESWTTSEYGTMSPRIGSDFNSVSQDSGFLSSSSSSSGFASSSSQAAAGVDDINKLKTTRDHDLAPVTDRGVAKTSSTFQLPDQTFTKSCHQGERTNYGTSLNTSSTTTVTSLAKDKNLILDGKASIGNSSTATKTSLVNKDKNVLLDNKTTHAKEKEEEEEDSLDGTVTTNGSSFSSPVTSHQQSSALTVVTNGGRQKLQTVASSKEEEEEEERVVVSGEDRAHSAQGKPEAGYPCGSPPAAARAAGSSSEASSVRRALTRKDSWIYVDVDEDWNISSLLLLPLFRILCYALSRPEMPYF
ncbi:uncharacterized protein LOC143298735 [Babylonia areolata]|uniref:uncharacterized protein LOC143298735 n=1 Tax=Babylonia areolata TaxID=304850 RepID=UPI003FD272BB